MATGDTKQVETIDLVSDQIDYDVHTDHCINTTFPTGILPHENQRLKTQADKHIRKQLKADILNEAIPIAVTIKKYFEVASDVKAAQNIEYTTSTCESVAKDVRKM